MSVTKLAVPFLALMVALTACGGNSQPAGGAGGSVAAGGAGGAPGPTSGSGGSLGAGGSQAPALGGAGGMVAAGGTTGAGGTTAPDGSAGSDSGAGGLAIDGGLDTADLRPETGVGLPGDARANDTAAMVICPKQVSGGKVPGVSAADFCATFETACMFNNLGVHYSSTADCLAKYNALSAAHQACRTAQLCYVVNGGSKSSCVPASGWATPFCSPIF
jgi:hypothetical protein